MTSSIYIWTLLKRSVLGPTGIYVVTELFIATWFEMVRQSCTNDACLEKSYKHYEDVKL